MIEPEKPDNENQRLCALYALRVLDTPVEERFDRITRIAQKLFDVPIALISLVDADRQWFKSRVGLTASETPRNISFCGHAILQTGPFVVKNAARDKRFKDNPLVTADPNIRFYAGQPLHDIEGNKLGTLCIIDRRPRTLTKAQLQLLQDLAISAENELNHSSVSKILVRIHASEERFRTLASHAPVGIFMTDAKGACIYVNDRWSDLSGLAPNEASGDGWTRAVHPEDRDIFFDVWNTATRDGREFQLEFRFQRPDGSVIWLSGSATTWLDRHETVAGYIGTITDLTRRKYAERQLMEATAVKQAILDSANFSIISTDAEGTIKTFNKAAQYWLGYTPGEVIDQQTPAILHDPEEITARARVLSQELGRQVEPGFEVFVAKARFGMVDENDWTYVRKDGTRFPVRLSVTALREDGIDITGFLGIASDISVPKQAIRERDQFFNLSLDMLCIAGFDGYFKQLNPAWERTFGFSAAELTAKPFIEFVHPEDCERTQSEAEKLMHGHVTVNFENRYRCQDGSYRWLLWSAAPFPEEKLIYAVARDITERKSIERMQKEFVSTVSHELRTPLTSIRGSLGLIDAGVAGEIPEKARELIGIAHKNSERLVRLINDILDSEKIASDKSIFEYEPVDVSLLVSQAVEANQHYAVQYHVTIKTGEMLPGAIVSADPNRLMQVMNNLLSNAAKYSPPNGEVIVSVNRQGECIRVSVTDQGSGIPPEFHNRVFERFSQADSSDTRQKGGTGLGLSIAKAIIERLDGKIDFVSKAGQGCTFYFELAEPRETNLVNKSAHGARRRALVCEDDPDVGKLLQIMLESAGLAVTICYNTKQAKDHLAAGQYDVMTLDLKLPDQDGVSLIRELRANQSTRHIPIVVVSAIAEESRRKLNGSAFEIVDWLNKPIDQERLLASVKQVLLRTRGNIPRILHIEDDADVHRILANLLADTAELSEAATLLEARHALGQNHYDLIILDIKLPDGSGIEILPDMRAANLSVPVLVFSAHELDQSVMSLVAGALVKSRTTNDELLHKIKSLLHQHTEPG